MRKALTFGLDSHRNAFLLLIQLAVCLTAAFAADWVGLLDGLETKAFDWRAEQWHRFKLKAPPQLIAADIDEKAEELTRPYPIWLPDDYLDALIALQKAGCAGVYIADDLGQIKQGGVRWSSLRMPIYAAQRTAEIPASRRRRFLPIPPNIKAALNLTASFSGAEPDERDGVHRLAAVLDPNAGESGPHYSIETLFAADALGAEPSELNLPIDARGRVLTPFQKSNMKTVSVGALLNGEREAVQAARGRWVVLGSSLPTAETARAAFGSVSAFELRAAMVNAMMTRQLARSKSGWGTGIVLALWFAALIPVGLKVGKQLPKARRIVLGGLLAAGVHGALALALFRWIWVPAAPICAALLGAAAIWSFSVNEARARLVERRALRAEREAAFGVMTSQVRHEIRNLLNSIRSPAEMLRRNFERGDPLGLAAEPEKIVSEMNMIMSRVTELSDMVENELNYLRDKTFRFVETDIWEIVQEARAAMEHDLEAQGVSVLEEAPETRRPVMADPEKLRAAFVNLIRNAAQAMPNGGRLRLIYSERRRRTVSVSVADTGAGMSPQQVEQAFDPFYTTKAKGLGLGLVTVKRIVETHRGKVTAVSVEGQGTSFEVALPAAR